jgi:hypothetical protein
VHRPDLIGIDFARVLRAGAKDMIRQADEGRVRVERDQRHEYETAPELCVLVFQERLEPPLWRMETVQPLEKGIGIVKVWDREPAFLMPELRNKLAGLFEVHDVAKTSVEARSIAASLNIREMGTIPLRDSQRREGESF